MILDSFSAIFVALFVRNLLLSYLLQLRPSPMGDLFRNPNLKWVSISNKVPSEDLFWVSGEATQI